MKDVWKWLLVGLLVFGLVFIGALPFFGGGWGPYGMMGPGMMGGYNMMGGFGFLAMLFVPLLFIGALVVGVVALIRGLGGVAPVGPVAGGQPGSRPCPHCGKFVQSDWKACPYCGEKL